MNFFANRFGRHDATACDADIPTMPINGIPNNAVRHTLLNVPTSSGKAAAKGVSQQSLEKHDQQFHHGHYDGGTCKYREQNNIKQGTTSAQAGGGGYITASSTSPSSPANEYMDVLNKGNAESNGGQSWTKKLPDSYQIPKHLMEMFFPSPKEDSTETPQKGEGAGDNGKGSNEKSHSQTDPLGRPVDANGNLIKVDGENGEPQTFKGSGFVGNGGLESLISQSKGDVPIDGRGFVNNEKKRNADFNARMKKILEESDVSLKPEKNNDDHARLMKSLEDFRNEVQQKSDSNRNPTNQSFFETVPTPEDPNNPPPDVTFVQTSFGGTEGFWRKKTEEEMQREIEENGELVPWRREYDHTGRQKYFNFKPEIKPHVKDFIQKIKGQAGKTRQLVNAAKNSGMTPAEWIDSRMKKLGIKPRFGRLTKNDVQRILEEKSAAEREFEQEDMSNTVAGNVWWMPKSS